jgi:hypothetical protein
MKIAVRLFLSSMIFAVLIAVAYWASTGDITGVVFLGMMALALIIVAAYIVVAEREADLAADRPDREPAQSAGEVLGAFTLESYWPILAALGSALLLCGIVFTPGISFTALLVGAALIAWTARFLVREST